MNKRQLLSKLDKQIDELEKINPDDPRIIELDEQASKLFDQIQTEIQQEAEQRQSQKTILWFIKNKYPNQTNSWYEWAKSLYSIVETDRGFMVKSNAIEGKPKTWPAQKLRSNAENHIKKLIEYKVNDRQKGIGDIEKDLIQTQED